MLPPLRADPTSRPNSTQSWPPPPADDGGRKRRSGKGGRRTPPKKPVKKRSYGLFRWFWKTFLLLMFLGGMGVVGGYVILYHYSRGLPDHNTLANYNPPVVTRVYAGDGRLLSEFATEKRVFVPIEVIPKRVINAFLAAEDKNFYNHPGVDWMSVLRAVSINAMRIGQKHRPVGGSTITQQVAKNFLLTNEVTLGRKAKEAILAFRIDRTYSKDRILELYLNQINLGAGSYGVAAAALNYFNKSLDELTVAQAAYLAALPKAPNNYHPVRNHDAALARRNWVIDRMLEENFVSADEAASAKREPLTYTAQSGTEQVDAAYFSEEIRRELAARFEAKTLYEGGLVVRSTLDAGLQRIAVRVFQDGVMAYDKRHGYRGAIARIDTDDWQAKLTKQPDQKAPDGWKLAVVLSLGAADAQIGVIGNQRGTIAFSDVTWARKILASGGLAASPSKIGDVLRVGDVVLVEPTKENNGDNKSYHLRQMPKVNGGLVALDPHTGRVLAMVGGFSHAASEFNRATQAQRQTGSTFKPFVYLAAMEEGFTPSTIILDEPISLNLGKGLGVWNPKNYKNEYLGATPLRVGLEKSRNLMTIRLAMMLGMDPIIRIAHDFGLVDKMPKQLAMALGAGESTLLQMTSGFGMLVNGGKRIVPTLIDRVQDRRGHTLYRHDMRDCDGCELNKWNGQLPPELPDIRQQVTDPASAYQVVSMLQGVVERGTGTSIKAVGKPLAGKTGTTNDSKDVWFVGFSPDLAVGAYLGFDQPKSLGDKETGGSVIAPMVRDFMAAALKDKPATPFRVPSGLRLVRVNPRTGLLAEPGDHDVIFDAFKPGTEPDESGAKPAPTKAEQRLNATTDGDNALNQFGATEDDTGTDSGAAPADAGDTATPAIPRDNGAVDGFTPSPTPAPAAKPSAPPPASSPRGLY
jgi:penicillin-binding protein 1A